MTAAQRIYIVGHGTETRLIRAPHKAQALAHVARSLINVKVATQDELVFALGRGISVESAVDLAQTTLVE